MKRFIFIPLLMILLAIASLGIAAYFDMGPLAKYIHKPKENEPPPPPPPHKIIYVGEIITPIVKNHAITAQIGMDVDIDVLATGMDKVNAMMPLIDHRIRMEMYDFLPSHSDTSSATDRQAVHDRVQWVIENAVGPGIVKEVTIRTFYSR